MNGLDAKVFSGAAARVNSWKRPLLLTHTNPDGDALGSLAAMRAILQLQGIEALAVLFDPLPGRYALFSRFEPMPILGVDISEDGLSGVDGIMVLDTCAYAQLRPIADWLRAADVPKIAVDHHITRDQLADAYVIDESAAANCLILHDWVRFVAWELDHTAREALFVGIAMDTGWFRHSNTDDRAFSAVATLASEGVSPHELYGRLFHRESPGRIRLLGIALEGMDLLAEGRLAIMTLDDGAFAKAGAQYADTEDIVNEPLRIDSVAAAVLMVARGDGVIRTSFRSKEPLREGGPDLDVARIAQALGGGGHRRAAGARITGELAAVRQLVADELQKVLG
ncbi:MAG: hypothetical protein JSU63_04860 [Phycisphaerales bacterium]|nr:MAG: hypothetical protein JSU63_04860 [Phycisphaerales bacterium]